MDLMAGGVAAYQRAQLLCASDVIRSTLAIMLKLIVICLYDLLAVIYSAAFAMLVNLHHSFIIGQIVWGDKVGYRSVKHVLFVFDLVENELAVPFGQERSEGRLHTDLHVRWALVIVIDFSLPNHGVRIYFQSRKRARSRVLAEVLVLVALLACRR